MFVRFCGILDINLCIFHRILMIGINDVTKYFSRYNLKKEIILVNDSRLVMAGKI